MPIDQRIHDAVALLETLRTGDTVRVTQDGSTQDMTVARGIHRSGGGCGSYASSRVTVTLGPGRSSTDDSTDDSTEVTAQRLAAGTQQITRVANLRYLGSVGEHHHVWEWHSPLAPTNRYQALWLPQGGSGGVHQVLVYVCIAGHWSTNPVHRLDVEEGTREAVEAALTAYTRGE